jgi:hypothetical protein
MLRLIGFLPRIKGGALDFLLFLKKIRKKYLKQL